MAVFDAAIESHAEVGRWMDWCRADLVSDETAQFVSSRPLMWEAGHDFTFGMFDHQGRLLGICGINQLNQLHRMANLGYWVRSSETGKGIASEAVAGLAQWAFDQLGLARVEILMMLENEASRRVAEKVGAVYEGRMRDRLQYQGQPYDAHLFGLLPSDLLS